MIVKNEEAVLNRCLECIHDIADEIIIVDTGSTDSTKRIARKHTKKIYEFKWVDDFAKARNYSFSLATKDYIMWLDADDVITKENREKLILLKNNLPSNFDIVTMKYNVAFDEHNNPTFHSTRGRLFKREKNYKWQDEVHEYIGLNGTMLHSDICIDHRHSHKVQTDRNLKIYERLLQKDGALSPRGKYYYARELKDHGKFQEAIRFFNFFLTEGKGWIEDNIASCYSLAICHKMLGEEDKAFEALQKSFAYDAPRAENCCLLGYYYKDKGDLKTAISWFETALNLPKKESIGFVLKDFTAYIPALELAVCYDKLQMFTKASQYNELAGKEKPESKEYLQNREYFATKLN